jgi:hypothetical protein
MEIYPVPSGPSTAIPFMPEIKTTQSYVYITSSYGRIFSLTGFAYASGLK